MTITLRHHPFTRAANVVWFLEEVGVPYALEWVDLRQGEHKLPGHKALNAMGKLPVLLDGDAVVSEVAAIGMYLADRYAPGRLAPALDAADRGAYLRWCVYGPSVVEPCAMAHSSKWDYNPASAGFGTWEEMHDTLERGIGDGPWILGDTFTMADMLLGGTLRWMLQFKMVEPRPPLVAWVERLNARPASVKAAAINAAIVEERGLGR
jgi:glutathione S-transferase